MFSSVVFSICLGEIGLRKN